MILNEENIPPIPSHILKHHSVVILGMDVVKINGTPFLRTTSRVVKQGMCTELPDTKTTSIVAALKIVINTYKSRGFSILAITNNYAFEAMKEDEQFMKTVERLNTTF